MGTPRELLPPHTNNWPLLPSTAQAAAARADGAFVVASVVHLGVHAPELQLRPTPQLTPQPPQFLASLAVLTHTPPHSV
jgi:hypothetical protein